MAGVRRGRARIRIRRVRAGGRGGVQPVEERDRVLQAHLRPEDRGEGARGHGLRNIDLPAAGERGGEGGEAEVGGGEGGEGGEGEEEGGEEGVAEGRRASDGLGCQDERRRNAPPHARQRSLDRLAAAAHQAARTRRRQHRRGRLAQDLPAGERRASAHQIRQVLGQAAVHGPLRENLGRRPSARRPGRKSAVPEVSARQLKVDFDPRKGFD